MGKADLAAIIVSGVGALLVGATLGCASASRSGAPAAPGLTPTAQVDGSPVDLSVALPSGGPGEETAAAGTPPTPPGPAELEYQRVAGKRCLEPLVIRGTPDDHDYVVAEQRWLEMNYPGYILVRQAYLEGRESKPGPADKGGTFQQEIDSVEFVTADGRNEAVCFSLYEWNP